MTSTSKIGKELTPILSNLNNFHSLQFVDRVSERQLQVGENSNWIIHKIPVQCWARVAAHRWFNGGQSSTPNTNLSRVCCILCANTGIHPMLFQCWCKVFDAGPSLKQHWVLVPSETPDNTIHWPNADVMLGHRLRRWANIIPIKTL